MDNLSLISDEKNSNDCCDNGSCIYCDDSYITREFIKKLANFVKKIEPTHLDQ